MTETVAAATAKEAEAAVKSEMIVFNGVSVHNIQLISKGLLNIIEHIFTVMEPESGIFGLVMDGSGKPMKDGKPMMALLYPDSMSVVMNLEFHWSEAFDLIEKEDNKLSLRGMLWYNQILTILHEIHHSKLIVAAGGDHTAVEWNEELEKSATEFAEERIIDLAKTFMIECPSNEEEPYFGQRLIEFREALGQETENPEPWIEFQRRMYDENIIASTTVEEEVLDIMSFKGFLRRSCKKEVRNDPVWEKDTNNIQPLPFSVDTPLDHGYYEPDPMSQYEDDFTIPIVGADAITPAPAVAPVTVAPSNVYTPPTGPAVLPTFVNPVTANMAGGIITPTSGVPAEGAASPSPVPALNLPIEEILYIVKSVYMRIYTHVFTKCGFNPSAPVSFDNPGAAYDPIAIGDIPNVAKVFLSMDITDSIGTKQNDVQIADQISGRVFTEKSGLPGYWLWLNVNGFKVKRVLVPQNPNKEKSPGVPSIMAQRVRLGWAIMWVIADGYGGAPSQMKVKIETQPGGATTYTENPFGNK